MNEQSVAVNRTGGPRFSAWTYTIAVYVPAIALAEVVGTFIGPVPSAICHAVLLSVLLAHYALLDEQPYRRILPVLALAPLTRLFSLTMPIRQVPQIYWYALVGIPLLIGVALTTRLLGFKGEEIGLRLRAWRWQVPIAFSGVPLSLVAFWIRRPAPLFTEPRWYDWVLGAAILLVFTGFGEEVLYRGLLQTAASDMPGLLAVLYGSVVFTIMYIGTLSLGYVLFVQVMALFFGWCVLRTRSIWGVVLAHSITNMGLLLLWPYVWS